MIRDFYNSLLTWKSLPDHKPLVIRGARQVGKTHSVREFAKAQFKNVIEINFDRFPDKKHLFLVPQIKEVIKLLQVEYSTTIIPGETLIFLDEIQAAPEVFPRLRYFYEDLPGLHVVAAGSLLEFLLVDHSFAMPVGRIQYMHMGPMTFPEFLIAAGEIKLVEFLTQYKLGEPFPPTFHSKLLQLLKTFFLVGGMPKAVSSYVETRDYQAVAMEHESILQSYVDDFAKYAYKSNIELLRKVFVKTPGLLGKKIKYVSIDPTEKSKHINQALQQLERARVIQRILHSAGNGVPLGAETKDSDFKLLFLDVGLVTSALGLRASTLMIAPDAMLINEGALAEQYVGQHLLYTNDPIRKPELYYWNRQSKNSSAEIDYLISADSTVVPIEVKSGKSGSLKSLHLFVQEKHKKIAMRFNSDFPSVLSVQADASNKQAFKLISLPLYMIGEVSRMLNKA